MIRSAGILPYKIIDNKIYVYLEHPGGPYYKNVDKWAICKGEFKNERAIDAAIREFREESGVTLLKKDLKYLTSHKVSHKKLVIMFYVNTDIDTSKIKSNTFKIEFPKGSGKIEEFPEMDEACWFLLDDAYSKIFESQIFFLDRLKYVLENEKNS